MKKLIPEKTGLILAFPTGRDSATFRDKGTEVPSLSWDKGTMGQAQNLAMGRDGPGQSKKGRSKTGKGRSKNRKGRSKTGKVCSKTGKDVVKQEIIGKK